MFSFLKIFKRDNEPYRRDPVQAEINRWNADYTNRMADRESARLEEEDLALNREFDRRMREFDKRMNGGS